MVQTPTQRRANEKYARREERKHGKAASATHKAEKPPISKIWIYMFIFLLAGGVILEVINLFFGL
ncbi:uncharacterized protein V1518DRAFT_410937 [Limtongia smithiae]|uniref:uncharacterized protein n=1 Tax=Limtongia smithiae TaxID=1125753 RepID=UPI0034CDCC37